jgi:hypothetical protein
VNILRQGYAAEPYAKKSLLGVIASYYLKDMG